MAVPFFEPRETATSAAQNHGDQVDGHSGTSATPTTATTSADGGTTTTSTVNSTTATTTTATSASNTLPSDNEQILAWKILAIAMCKALKDYYQQSSSPQEAFTSGNGNIVQVLPNGEVQPLWK